MALQKWVPCKDTNKYGRQCRAVAKYIAIDQTDEGVPTTHPVCDEHANKYNRLLELSPKDVEHYGVL